MTERIVLISLWGRNGVKAHALVSESDAEHVNAFRWGLNANGYAQRTTHRQIGSKNTFLHRFLMGCVPGDGTNVDHINGDKLDDRRSNLRLVTHKLNIFNQRPAPSSTGVRGVTFIPHMSSKHPWRAQIRVSGRMTHLGMFATIEEATAARQAAELAEYGEMAQPLAPA